MLVWATEETKDSLVQQELQVALAFLVLPVKAFLVGLAKEVHPGMLVSWACQEHLVPKAYQVTRVRRKRMVHLVPQALLVTRDLKACQASQEMTDSLGFQELRASVGILVLLVLMSYQVSQG